MGSKYHIVKNWKTTRAVVKSKKRDKRGKYRSATVNIGGTVLNVCLWNDSSLLGGCSADLGCEEHQVQRRYGRHTPTVPCPRMMVVRGLHFRAVDSHDQLRACKWKMVFICKTKAWPKLVFGLYEILVVQIYIVRKQKNPNLQQQKLRWTLVHGLVSKAKELDARRQRNQRERSIYSTPRRSRRQRGMRVSEEGPENAPEPDESSVVPRFEGASKHHHDRLQEYVSPEQARINMDIARSNPTVRKCKRVPRARHAHRKTHKVRNPLFTSAGVCLVCKYQYGRRRETLRYCRECCVDDFTGWPRTNRATGFAKKFHPRLCSKECFELFHSHNIK